MGRLSYCPSTAVGYQSRMYISRQGKMVIRKFSVIVLAFIFALSSESFLFAQNQDAGAQASGSGKRLSAIGKKRSRKKRLTMKCRSRSSPEFTKPEGQGPPMMEAPPLILDPTDREPGPPKEIVPQHIDPADMPAIKKPPKKKAKPQ